MTNRYFVSAVKRIRVFYRDVKGLRGNSFDLKVVFSSSSLDRSGFVIDFEKVSSVLDRFKKMVESEELNAFVKSDCLDFRDFLIFTKDFVERSVEQHNIFIEEVSVFNEEEGYIARFENGCNGRD